MAVPNNDSFNMQDVKNEIGSISNDLISYFAQANSAGFDPLYVGSKNSLSNFRNYNHNAGASITVSPRLFDAFANGATFTVTVTANVAWTVSDNVSWITTSPSSGSNNGSFNVTVASYPSGADRSGIITVSGSGASATVRVNQRSINP